MKLSIVIAETAIETIPKSLHQHRMVKYHASKLNKSVDEVLLDINYHYFAMKKENLEHIEKRGRPDILHICLLSILSTPLFFEKAINVYVHTIDNKVIFIGDDLRIPKSYRRFEGLMMKLFINKKIEAESDSGKMLLEVRNMRLEQLIEKIKPDVVIGFSTTGKHLLLERILTENLTMKKGHYVFIIGGFQSGHFSEETVKRIDKIYSISRHHLEAHIVISRLIYECEKYLCVQNPN